MGGGKPNLACSCVAVPDYLRLNPAEKVASWRTLILKPGHHGFQSCALPTELHHQLVHQPLANAVSGLPGQESYRSPRGTMRAASGGFRRLWATKQEVIAHSTEG